MLQSALGTTGAAEAEQTRRDADHTAAKATGKGKWWEGEGGRDWGGATGRRGCEGKHAAQPSAQTPIETIPSAFGHAADSITISL